MSPTIVKHQGKNFLVTGSPGGSRIITTTLQVIMNVIDHGLNIESAVAAPRIHHQWLPNKLWVEADLPADVRQGLRRRGHELRAVKHPFTAVQVATQASKGQVAGASDPRKGGAPAAP